MLISLGVFIASVAYAYRQVKTVKTPMIAPTQLEETGDLTSALRNFRQTRFGRHMRNPHE